MSQRGRRRREASYRTKEVTQVGETAVGASDAEQAGDDSTGGTRWRPRPRARTLMATVATITSPDRVGKPDCLEKTRPEPEWYTVPSAVVQLTMRVIRRR